MTRHKSPAVATTVTVAIPKRVRANRLAEPKRSESGQDADRVRSVLKKFRTAVGLFKRQNNAVDRLTGLSGAHLRALICIEAAPGMSVTELARELGIHASTASNMLDVLERDGHIGRRRIASDQRVVKVYLSDQGRSTLRLVPEPQRGALQGALLNLPLPTLKALDRTLDALLAQMGAGESVGNSAK
jgi:DNA-binding MarR family transcriptional regulator